MRFVTAILIFFFLFQLNAPGQQRQLDTTTFVVLGEGLAAGMADFALRDVYQEKSFPAQMARQMQTIFPQPLLQPPGLGRAPGFASLPIRAPAHLQTTIRHFPPQLFVFNLSVPGFKVTDSVSHRPVAPLIHDRDPQQTLINFLLGFPALLVNGAPLWSQLEYAVQMRPTLVLIELGYFDVLDAAVQGDLGLLPTPSAFRSSYAQILDGLQPTFAQIVVLTIPDPLHTAYFSTLEEAAALVGAPAEIIQQLWDLNPQDLVSPTALTAMGNQILSGSIEPLPQGSVMDSSTAAAIRNSVQSLNSEVISLAQQEGSVIYDLHGFFEDLDSQGFVAGTRRLTTSYLGGLYSLDGYYPGMTVHALLANELLDLLNQTYGSSFAPVDIESLVAVDPAAISAASAKKPYSMQELRKRIPNLDELILDRDSQILDKR